MRISDWSSDVCSSDLPGAARPASTGGAPGSARTTSKDGASAGIADTGAVPGVGIPSDGVLCDGASADGKIAGRAGTGAIYAVAASPGADPKSVESGKGVSVLGEPCVSPLLKKK